MNNEVVLLESRTLRGSLVERTEALEKVRALTLLPDGVHVTARMVADYFEVGDRAVNTLVNRHREELQESGYTVLKGAELQSFLSFNMKLRKLPGAGLGVFPRRAVLNVAMLLRDSPVAREVRRALLDLVDGERGAARWQEAMVEQISERSLALARAELRELKAANEELCERVRALEEQHVALRREVELGRELLGAMSVRLADAACEVRTMGGRLDMLCTQSAAPGQGRRRRRW